MRREATTRQCPPPGTIRSPFLRSSEPWFSSPSLRSGLALLGNRQIVTPNQFSTVLQRLFIENVFHFTSEFLRQVAPRVLVDRQDTLRLRLRRLRRRHSPSRVAGRSGASLLATGLLAWLTHLSDHRHPALRGGVAKLLDDGVKLLDDLFLLLARFLSGVGFAEPLLDVAHLFDDI